MYADLDSMRALQLAIGFSECETAEDGQGKRVCWRHSALKSAWLGNGDDALDPPDYSVVNVSQSEITMHTSFCAHPPLTNPWHLAVAAPPSRANTTVGMQLRATLLRVHGVGTTHLAVTNPTAALFALPIETTGWDREQVIAHGHVRRAGEVAGNAGINLLEFVRIEALGVEDACPALPASGAAVVLPDAGDTKAGDDNNDAMYRVRCVRWLSSTSMLVYSIGISSSCSSSLWLSDTSMQVYGISSSSSSICISISISMWLSATSMRPAGAGAGANTGIRTR